MAELGNFLPEPQVKRLKKYDISSVDDLYAIFTEDRPAVADLLGLSDDDADQLGEAIRPATSPEVVAMLDAEDDSPRPLDPVPDEHDGDTADKSQP